VGGYHDLLRNQLHLLQIEIWTDNGAAPMGFRGDAEGESRAPRNRLSCAQRPPSYCIFPINVLSPDKDPVSRFIAYRSPLTRAFVTDKHLHTGKPALNRPFTQKASYHADHLADQISFGM
jgi:hypothetical protein